MQCPHCGHPGITDETERCPNCEQPLRQSAGTRIDSHLQVGTAEDGSDVAGVKIGKAGDVTIVLNTSGITSDQENILTPVVMHYAFVGRQKEMEDLIQTLREGHIVQIHGLGGIGKTSLAAATAKQLWIRKVFPKGILWVSDVGTAPLSTICDAIARHLHEDRIPKLPAESRPDATRELLARHEKLLIVLDRIESPGTVQQFVDRCLPEGGVLLTTGRTKHVASDRDVLVPPLQRSDAIALFKSRAKWKDEPTEEPLIDEICALLDNHPLAIVIAAGRVRAESLPLKSLKLRLADEKSRLKSLQLEMGTDAEQSLQACLNLSYQYLDKKQRQVFHSLAACFSDTISLPLLAEICGMEEWECEDIGGQLVLRSLAERRDNRFYMQHLVRDFGRSVPEVSALAIQGKVLQVLSSYVERYRENDPHHFDLLELEISNLLGAIRWAIANDKNEEAVKLVKIIARPVSGLLGVRGYWSELVDVGKLGLQAAEKCNDLRAVAQIAQYIAIVHQRQDSYREAQAYYQRSLKIYQDIKDDINVAVAKHNLGILSLEMCHYPEAQQLFDESQKLYRGAGDQIGISRSLHELGRLAFIQGDFLTAKQLFGQSLVIKESMPDKPDRRGMASALFQLGEIAREQGDWPEAQGLYARSQQIYSERKDSSGLAAIAESLARIYREQGNFAEAQRLFGEAGITFDKLADQSGIAENQLDLGHLMRDLGQLEICRKYLEKGLEIYLRLEHPSGTAWAKLELGWLAWQTGGLAEARRLLIESQDVFEKNGEKLGIARSLHLLGRVAFSEGDSLSAIQLTEKSADIHKELKVRLWLARDLHQLGLHAAHQGNLTVARQYLKDALALHQALGSADVSTVKVDLTRLA
jgi:tetratricopeptide (TPR) repeat protein